MYAYVIKDAITVAVDSLLVFHHTLRNQTHIVYHSLTNINDAL